MSREIKFRAMDDVRTKWVFGSLMNGYNWADFIIEDAGFEHRVRVNSETIGQFTGLKDKNGEDIYEGDILQDSSERIMVVSWNKRFASFCLNSEGWAFTHFFVESLNPEDVEIIGNIHQNKNLLI